jgi:ATP-dependent helicase/nuclease subunit A
VALTRTQRTLVVSSLQPHIANPGSWWQRLQEHADDAPWQAQAAGGEPSKSLADGDFTLLCLPNMPLDLVEYSQAAIESIANPSPTPTDEEDGDTLDSRIGQAMHRLLERYLPAAQPDAPVQLASDAQQDAIAREFALEPAHLAQAQAMALAIVQGEGAWAWDTAELDWQGNEVAVVQRGRVLRIDRLVRRRAAMPDEGQWWVLDYKSTRQPHHHPELCEQLLGYRSAVALAQPGQTVRAAFLTPDGTLIELSAP